MRISWGYKILFFYLSFVVGMLFLVFKASNENYDLVTENYYEAELKYQDVIDQKSNVAQLSARPKILHTVNSISVQMPPEFGTRPITGEIYLYCPADVKRDLRKTFSTSEGFVSFDLSHNLSGLYQVKLSWIDNGKQYFQEQKIFF